MPFICSDGDTDTVRKTTEWHNIRKVCVALKPFQNTFITFPEDQAGKTLKRQEHVTACAVLHILAILAGVYAGVYLLWLI